MDRRDYTKKGYSYTQRSEGSFKISSNPHKTKKNKNLSLGKETKVEKNN